MKADYFHKIDGEEKAYWLGFILGDGCLAKDGRHITVDLKTSDDGHLVKFARAVELNNELRYYVDKTKTYNCVRMLISNKQLYNDLINLGLTPAKSLTAKWLKIPKKYELHMLRGLFDADGSIFPHKYRGRGQEYKYQCAGFNLVGTKDCVQNAKRILKLDSKVRHFARNCWIMQKCGNPSVLKVYNLLYKDATVWLDRKKEKFEELLRINSDSVA